MWIIRVTALRAARAIKMDMIKVAGKMLADPHPFVWRELCLAMNYEPTDKAIPILVKLADKYDGSDRWYLEAFGIGCTDREKEVLAAWESEKTNKDPKVAEGITWRLKKEPTPGSSVDAADKSQPVASWWALGAGRRGKRRWTTSTDRIRRPAKSISRPSIREPAGRPPGGSRSPRRMGRMQATSRWTL